MHVYCLFCSWLSPKFHCLHCQAKAVIGTEPFQGLKSGVIRHPHLHLCHTSAIVPSCHPMPPLWTPTNAPPTTKPIKQGTSRKKTIKQQKLTKKNRAYHGLSLSSRHLQEVYSCRPSPAGWRFKTTILQILKVRSASPTAQPECILATYALTNHLKRLPKKDVPFPIFWGGSNPFPYFPAFSNQFKWNQRKLPQKIDFPTLKNIWIVLNCIVLEAFDAKKQQSPSESSPTWCNPATRRSCAASSCLRRADWAHWICQVRQPTLPQQVFFNRMFWVGSNSYCASFDDQIYVSSFQHPLFSVETPQITTPNVAQFFFSTHKASRLRTLGQCRACNIGDGNGNVNYILLVFVRYIFDLWLVTWIHH